MSYENLTRIDASSFVDPLARLSETIALKVDREGQGIIPAPRYVYQDLFVQLRYAQRAFLFTIYLNSDDTRENDCSWSEQHSVIGLTAVRSLIDCLYNVTLILQDPCIQGKRFRMSGLRKFVLNIEQDRARYGDDPKWASFLEMRQAIADRIASEIDVTMKEVTEQGSSWDTLGRYLHKAHKKPNSHQRFLHSLTLGSWGEYSSLAHASFDGLIPHTLYSCETLCLKKSVTS